MTNNNLKKCTLCPRNCNAIRSQSSEKKGEYGACGVGNMPVVARAAAHYWEEPCVSGEKGSGAIFFSGCPLGCVYCQNKDISKGIYGKEISVERLRQIMEELEKSGVHNINLVTPTHFTDAILKALQTPLKIPLVYNCSGYEKVETLKKFEGKIQVYLPDMKYSLSGVAAKYSFAPDYPETAKTAILEMFRQTGPVELDNDGIIKKGVIIRHLVLPSNIENTKSVIDWVKNTFEKGTVLFSLMSQYTPVVGLEKYPEINRRLTKAEYKEAEDYLFNSGIEDGFLQELSSANEEYTPPFDLTGV